MRNWLNDAVPVAPRPLLYIEDVSADVVSLCDDIARRERIDGEPLLDALTVMLLDRPGPDTQKLVLELLDRYPALQVVAGPFTISLRQRLLKEGPIESTRPASVYREMRRRCADVPETALSSESEFTDFVDTLIRPGSLVICDINLKPLTFAAAQSQSRDAETLKGVVAANHACKRQGQLVDGFAQDVAQISILSGIKEFLMVSQPLEKLEVKIDSRLVFEKSAKYDDRDLTPTLAARQHLKNRFPWNLRVRSDKTGLIHCHRVGEQDRAFLDRSFHLVIGQSAMGNIRWAGERLRVARSWIASARAPGR